MQKYAEATLKKLHLEMCKNVMEMWNFVIVEKWEPCYGGFSIDVIRLKVGCSGYPWSLCFLHYHIDGSS